MQLISAVVRPTKVGEICDALQTLGFHGLTVTDASGLGNSAATPRSTAERSTPPNSSTTPSSRSSPVTTTSTT